MCGMRRAGWGFPYITAQPRKKSTLSGFAQLRFFTIRASVQQKIAVTLTIKSILLLTATCNLKVQEVIGLCFVKLFSPVSGVCAAVKGQRSFGSVSCLQRGHCAFHTMAFWSFNLPADWRVQKQVLPTHNPSFKPLYFQDS